MKRTTINLHTRVTANLHQARSTVLAGQDRERGSITVEHIMWAVIIVGLVTVVGGVLTAWATGKIGQLG